MQAKVGKNITYIPGTTLDKDMDIQAAVRAAREADVAVVCLGEGSYAETPGNITDLTLGEAQLRLAEAIEATGKPVVLVLVEGRPRVINRIADRAQQS
jgi:beta-glucosidase